MPSIIRGFTYDIFISYRQKDNKYDGWVTEFVSSLKKELEVTSREEISVYFDINPEDGLLEMHDVGASIGNKLASLIFIPVISRTYCDPHSFAWEHEFKAFKRQAAGDRIGMKITLPDGNVTSRILPILIYDLRPDDKALLESELGGPLRPIEFIYKEPGVNRPLTPGDEEKLNLNKTRYRNQINKVSNTIDAIICSLKESDRKGISLSSTENNSGQHITDIDKEPHIKHHIKKKLRIVPVVSVLLILLGLLVGYKLTEDRFKGENPSGIEKSIAVLPFVNDSPDEDNAYFINGIMEEILNNLQKIKEFRVLSRTSVEQYRGSNKPSIPVIAKNLNINYIVEGSAQKYGSRFRLRVQLIAAKNERHLWAQSYEQEISNTKDIFGIQSQVAQAIASELQATITPEVKKLIDKPSTESLTAYDFYQRGKEEFINMGIYGYRPEIQEKTEVLFRKSVESDSAFAPGYIGLAKVILNKWFKDNTVITGGNLNQYFDSVLYYAEKAISFDPHLADAYQVLGQYYSVRGTPEMAIEKWSKALEINPNDSYTYFLLGGMYEELDIQKSLENLQKAALLNHDQSLPDLLGTIGYMYYMAGFPDKGKEWLYKAYLLDRDSLKYQTTTIRYSAETSGNYKEVIEHFQRIYQADSLNVQASLRLGYYYALTGKVRESLRYYDNYISLLKRRGRTNELFGRQSLIGYAFKKNGRDADALSQFDRQIKYLNNRLTSLSPGERIYWVYPLAGIYALMGNREMAYENLKIFEKSKSFTLAWVILIRNDPQFDLIRDDEEFKRIVRSVETKYLAEHEKVRKWLEEQE